MVAMCLNPMYKHQQFIKYMRWDHIFIFQFGCHGNPKWPPKMADINVKFYKMASTHMNVQVTDGYCILFLAQTHILIL